MPRLKGLDLTWLDFDLTWKKFDDLRLHLDLKANNLWLDLTWDMMTWTQHWNLLKKSSLVHITSFFLKKYLLFAEGNYLHHLLYYFCTTPVTSGCTVT